MLVCVSLVRVATKHKGEKCRCEVRGRLTYWSMILLLVSSTTRICLAAIVYYGVVMFA